MARKTREQLATLAQIKTYSKQSGSTKDADMTTFLPVAEQAILDITHNSWNVPVVATYASGTTTVTINSIGIFEGSRTWGVSPIQYYSPDDTDYRLDDFFQVGNVVIGDGIPDRATIASIDVTNKQITISSNTTAAGATEDIYINQAPVSLKMILAQMVLYNVDTFDGSYQVSLESETVGSFSYTAGGEDIGGSGYPEKLEKALMAYKKVAFA